MPAPTLRTVRLDLRPPAEGDLDAWAELDADGEAMRFIGGPHDRRQAWHGLATAAGMWALRGCGLFSVIERDSGRWIGRVGPWVPEGHVGTEVGWALTRNAWGKGYAVEAAGAAIDWAFANLGWTEVVHCIDGPNQPSVRVAERLGSRWRRRDIEADGKPVEIYGQMREDWQAGGKGRAAP